MIKFSELMKYTKGRGHWWVPREWAELDAQLDDIRERLDALEAASAEPSATDSERWIRTEDELPQKSVDVWIAFRDGIVSEKRAYCLGPYLGWTYSGPDDEMCPTPEWWAPILEKPPMSPIKRKDAAR